MNFNIYPCQVENLDDILALTQTTLGGPSAVQKTPQFWHWKHHANPFGPSYGWYAWDACQSKMAGLRVLMQWHFKQLGLEINAVRAVDTATHPNYQRQGIFTMLTQHAIADLQRNGIHFIFNTPNERSLLGYLKLGWQKVTLWPLFIKLLCPMRMGLRRLKIASSAPPPAQFRAYFGADILTWTDFVARYQSQALSLIDHWETHRSQQTKGLRTPRSWAYLQWRYGDHPHLQYGVYPLLNREVLLGLAVLRPNQRYGWQEVVLNELFLAESEVGRNLFKGLSQAIQADYIIASFSTQSWEYQCLKQANFWPVPRRGITFTVRPLQTGSTFYLNPSAWDLSLGDLELF